MAYESHYMAVSVMFTGLEDLLNEVERHASGYYEIVSVMPIGSARSQVGVVIRFLLADDDPPFDEEEIKRKLGII